jgi:hypothetical protein
VHLDELVANSLTTWIGFVEADELGEELACVRTIV